jgi:hypothetical protein
MYICAAGDIHGALNKLYDEVLDFEASLGIRFDFVLHVGDFGIWPDPARSTKARAIMTVLGTFLLGSKLRVWRPGGPYSSRAITRTFSGSTRSQPRRCYPISPIYPTVRRST